MKPILTRQIISESEQTFALGAAPIVFNPRESLIDALYLYVEGNIATVAATAHINGLAQLIKSITLAGSVAGGRFEPFSGMTDPDMYEIAQWQRGSSPIKFGALGSTGRFRICIPLYFREFFMGDELLNLLPAIPAWKMSDLKLTVTPAAQADADVNGTPTLALTAGAVVGVEVHQFFRETVPDGLRTIKTSYELQLEDAPATKNPYEIKLPRGGDYSFIGFRSFDGSNTRQLETDTTGPITYPAGFIRLLELSRNTRLDSAWNKLRAQNAEVMLDSLVDGNAAFLFNRWGPRQLFQTGAIGQALNNVTIQLQTTSVSNGSIRVLFRRLFGPGEPPGHPTLGYVLGANLWLGRRRLRGASAS